MTETERRLLELLDKMTDRIATYERRLQSLEQQEILRKLWLKGPNVTSATTITLGQGNYFAITASNNISYITTTGWTVGSIILLYFSAGLTLIHNGGASPATALPLFLQGAANLPVVADDIALFILDTTHWRIVALS